MNIRKINFIRVVRDSFPSGLIEVYDGTCATQHELVDSAVSFLNRYGYRKAAFARRPFLGARKLSFEITSIGGMQFYRCFEYTINLCAKKCWEILKVGKRTKKFSIWIRKENN